MDPVISLKRKVSVDTDYLLCIICQTTKIQDNCSHLTARGVDTLKSAMQQRRDDVYERLWSCIEDVDYFLSLSPIYHTSCKNGYTHKKELAPKKSKTADLDSVSCSTTGSRTNFDYKSVCFLCDKLRDRKGGRQLTLVSTTERQHSIHMKAKSLCDEALLTKIQVYGTEVIDMIANDFRYHKLCMDKFMTRRVTPPMSNPERDRTNEAFDEFITEVTDSL